MKSLLGCRHARGGVFCQDHSRSLLPIWMWSFYPFFAEKQWSSFQIFSEGNDPHAAVVVLCAWEEAGSECTCAAILGPSFQLFLFSNVGTECYKFPSQYCFSYDPEILYVVFFIGFNVFFLISSETSSFLMDCLIAQFPSI